MYLAVLWFRVEQTMRSTIGTCVCSVDAVEIFFFPRHARQL